MPALEKDVAPVPLHCLYVLQREERKNGYKMINKENEQPDKP
jgi:hypothetical protein